MSQTEKQKIANNKAVRRYRQTNKGKTVNQQYAHNWYLKHKLQYTEKQLKKLYNLTLKEYEIMFEAQNGVCAICGLPQTSKRLAVDHDHKTGEIRGLLCNKCNTRLAVLENKDWVKRAKGYLS